MPAYQIEALWNGLRDDNGSPYSGAIVVTYAAGTSTPKAVWQDRDKTLPTSEGLSQFTLDSNGRYKAWGDGVYKIVLYAPTDTLLTTPLYEVDGAQYGWGDLSSTVANLTALQALAVPSGSAAITLAGRTTNGDGGGGAFVWDSLDLSAEVASDTLSGIYVAPNSDATGASGAWVRQHSGAVNVKWFGAVGDGVTDDTAAIQAAIDANLGAVYAPRGIYNHTGLMFPDTSGLFGDHWVTIFVNTATDGSHSLLFEGEAVTPSGTGRNIEQLVRDVVLKGNASSGDGIRLHMIGRVDNGITDTEPSNCIIEHVKIIDHGGAGIQFGESSTTGAGNKITITNSVVSYNNCGIKIVGQSNTATILGNTISNNTVDGVYLNFVASTNLIQHNQIMDNGGYGVYAFSAEQPFILYNGFNRNSSGAVALTGNSTKYTEAAVVTGNLCGDNGSGAATQREVTVTYTKGATINSNYFYGTGQDQMIYLSDYSEGVLILGNHFKDLTTETKLFIKVGAVDTWYRFEDFGQNQASFQNLISAGHGEVISPKSLSIASGVVDLSSAPSKTYAVSVTENITSITFPSSPTAGQSFKLRLKQQASYTVTGWPANVRLIGGSYTLSSTGRIDVLTFEYISSEWVEISRASAVI